MHPEVLSDKPGACPICGMALEPRVATLDEQPNEELHDMQRRFVISAILTAPLLVLDHPRHAADLAFDSFQSIQRFPADGGIDSVRVL